ncbi:MAG: dTMP kinase [Rhodospirillaceae bacterium]|jgi:dTMP kinase|nr:dTMP kinase [Rhodospirillaceae bacterium]MBT5943639.1 dTMP kinase [Rhodospirillaceae bacterium]MBT6404840.1 dTMP kinase [Rhodospirillaceae bacterium]MBT6534693.1 dTMP kinase [Rhodospirillaceae bacterium]MBT7362583.1 dTMP kinase [Rhodospirillaceae bacterium]
MIANQPRGKFITFEGGEGAGKTTQIARLADRLQSRGITTITTREPGGAPGADSIRSLLVSGATDKWDPISEVLLLYAGRREHLRQTILPALNQGAWVLCDRFSDSTMAYQGYGHGISKDFIRTVHDEVVGASEPDLTLILDIPVDIGVERAVSRNTSTRSGEDRFERMDKSFHERLRAGFLDIAAHAPERVRVIDADSTPEVITEAVWEIVIDRFELTTPAPAP